MVLLDVCKRETRVSLRAQKVALGLDHERFESWCICGRIKTFQSKTNVGGPLSSNQENKW